MEKRKFNYADMTQVSKKTLDRNKRLAEQVQSAIREYDEKLRKEIADKEAKLHEEMLKNAGFTQNSIYSRNKARVKALQEKIAYQDNSVKSVLSSYLVSLVEKALVLDVESYEKMLPNYREVIHETVVEMLGKVNSTNTISDKRVRTLMEHIVSSLPSADTGIYMTEESIIKNVRDKSSAEINSIIDSLSGDVRARVVNIIEEEQAEAAKINDELDNITKDVKPKEEVETVIKKEELLQGLQSGKLTLEMLDQLVQSGEVTPEVAEEVKALSQPEATAELEAEDEDEFVGEELPVEADKELPAEVTPASAFKHQVEIDPSGTVRVNVVKETFYREVPKKGILETLTLTEAHNQIKTGKYDGVLALSNAIVKLTITEAVRILGL